MGAAASVGGKGVSGDTGDELVDEVGKMHLAGKVNDLKDAECEATLSEYGIP